MANDGGKAFAAAKKAEIERKKAGIEQKKLPQSEYAGVSWSSNEKKWKANVTIDGKQYWVGLFEDDKEA